MQALALRREMFAQGHEANVVSYNASVSTSEKWPQWVQDLGLLREVFAQRLEANVVSSNASVSASEKGSQCVPA